MNNEQEKKTEQVLTLYFTENLVDSLDDLIHAARKEMPIYKRRKLNRTTLIQLVLNEIMDNHEKYKSESFVWKLLLNAKEN
jgi:hypothetical protein